MSSKATKEGIRKTAVLLIALGPDISAQILKQSQTDQEPADPSNRRCSKYS